MQTLYVIDAPNMVHRAAAAGVMRPNLAGMLRRFLRVADPRFVVAVWDDRDASLRRELWPGYKADREHRDDVGEMMVQARAVIDAFGIASLGGLLGLEADDLVATVATKAPPDFRVVMISCDKDLLQLVDERTVLASRRGGASTIHRLEDVRREYGIEPVQWPSVMALAGAKNGVPGLPGIGFKGALALIAKYGDLETLIARVRTVEKRTYRVAIEGNAEQARLFLRLMTLRRDAPIDCPPERWRRERG